MSGVLLVHESAFQIHCANRLFAAGAIGSVIVEAGGSVPRERPEARELLSAVRAGIENVAADRRHGPRRAILQLLNVRRRGLYYGRRDFHHRRLLSDHERFHDALDVEHVASVNDDGVAERIRARRPEIVFVHGTGLIGKHVRTAVEAPFVNLHWGWSPEYRGEGIVSALAMEGAGALGVTVHALDDRIDGGPIHARGRPTLDEHDNFYSIGVKLTILGTQMLIGAWRELHVTGALATVPQDRARSRLFSGRYLRAHPELYLIAWEHLRKHGRTRDG